MICRSRTVCLLDGTARSDTQHWDTEGLAATLEGDSGARTGPDPCRCFLALLSFLLTSSSLRRVAKWAKSPCRAPTRVKGSREAERWLWCLLGRRLQSILCQREGGCCCCRALSPGGDTEVTSHSGMCGLLCITPGGSEVLREHECSVKAEQSHGRLWSRWGLPKPRIFPRAQPAPGVEREGGACGFQAAKLPVGCRVRPVSGSGMCWSKAELAPRCSGLSIPPPKTTFGLGCVGRPPPHRAQRRKIRQSFKGCAGSAGTGGEKVPLLPARARDKLLLLQLLPKGQNQHHSIFLPLHVGSIAWIISRTWKTQSKAFAPF
nr:uncharacterized protein LOC106017445 isoform X2 [Anas platyrhynchos]XP_038040530.1 uncharacterized protein LOC106017445 isoform X2 [Anas platyrhynchos]XP_038040532.1 uncharacterized protein LOC106017445 isoform X2 [Anas platyrhynchos]